MLPYPLEDFLQVSLHSLFRGMVDIGKFLDGSLLAADAEILPEYQVLVRCQDAVKQGIDLLGDFKTGRTVEGMMVIAVILDAVLRSEVLPLVLILHVGVLLVKEFPVDVHLLLLDNLIVIRLAGLRGMAASFCLVADAQGTDAHQVILDSHVTEQLLSLLGVEHLTLPVNPAGAESDLMGCQHHGLKDDAAVIDFIAIAPVGEDEDDGGRTVIGIARGAHHLGVHLPKPHDECRVLHGYDMGMLGTHASRRPCSGFEYLDEFVILDLLILELAHAAARLDAIYGIHVFSELNGVLFLDVAIINLV